MPNLPPLAAVRVFEAAARHENFSRAAQELAMTQAGVSYQIKLLEERLGARLFARKGRGMVLTPLGQRIAPRVSEAFGLLDGAFAQARAESETVLSISAPSSFATLWLSARIGDFQLRNPRLAVRLTVDDRLVDLDGGEFDLAIRGVPRPDTALEAHLVMRHGFTPMATPDFMARHGVRKPEDVLRVARISPGGEWWQCWLKSLKVVPEQPVQTGGIRFDSQLLDGQAALAGHGLAVLNPAMFADELAEGRLVAPFAQMARDGRAIWLCYPPHRRRQAKVQAFRDWLLDEARAALGDDPFGLLLPLPAHQPSVI